MDEETANTVQVVTAVIAVSTVTVAALILQPVPTPELAVLVGSSFTSILALLGVHYGIRIIRKNGNG